jgi:hypothetical protein
VFACGQCIELKTTASGCAMSEFMNETPIDFSLFVDARRTKGPIATATAEAMLDHR